jgi:hypothetical protein
MKMPGGRASSLLLLRETINISSYLNCFSLRPEEIAWQVHRRYLCFIHPSLRAFLTAA